MPVFCSAAVREFVLCSVVWLSGHVWPQHERSHMQESPEGSRGPISPGCLPWKLDPRPVVRESERRPESRCHTHFIQLSCRFIQVSQENSATRPRPLAGRLGGICPGSEAQRRGGLSLDMSSIRLCQSAQGAVLAATLCRGAVPQRGRRAAPCL